jgi:hypothetical protein
MPLRRPSHGHQLGRPPGCPRTLPAAPRRAHKRTEVLARCAADNVELVFIPTNASWLNWIEAEFAALRYYAPNGTDHRSHDEQDQAIARYVRWRNGPRPPQARLPHQRQDHKPGLRGKLPGQGFMLSH